MSSILADQIAPSYTSPNAGGAWHIGRYAAIVGVEGLELTGGKCDTLECVLFSF
jgi:hypothetical protein